MPSVHRFVRCAIPDRDTKKAEEDHRAALLDAELAKFHEQALGVGQYHSGNNWVFH